MSDERRKRAEEFLASIHGLPDRKYIIDVMLAFADEAVAKERALQENTIATLNSECNDLNNKVVQQIAIINDIAMMGRRLGYALKRAGTNDALVRQCVELFKKYDLGGSVIRAEAIERGET